MAQAQAQQGNGHSNGNSNSKKDGIVIEDSPSASVAAPASSMINNAMANPTALAFGREGIDVSESAWSAIESQSRMPNVIDLCDSDENIDANLDADAAKLKKNRKRKQPSDDVIDVGDDEQPKKKRKIDESA